MNKLLLFFLFSIILSCQNDEIKRAGMCISFDDRSIKEWYGMRDLFKKYDAHVTFFITQFDSLDSIEISMLKELQKDGHEIGSHGALHVFSGSYIQDNSYNEYMKNEIDASITAMNKNGFYPSSFAYPYGAKYRFTDILLLNKFKVLRGVEAMNNEKDLTLLDNIYYTFNGDKTMSSMGIDKNSELTKEIIDKAIKRACDKKEVLLLHGHAPITASENGAYNFDQTLLEYILKEAKLKKLAFITYQDLI